MHTLNIFSSILLVLLFLGIFVPYMNTALNESVTSPSISSFESTVEGSNYLTIALNIVALPLWTFGLNYWINLVVLLPLRIIGLISLWYIINPAKS